MAFTLEGRTALVTGAGRGIGRAIAKRLRECGATVMVNDLDEGVVKETAEMFGCSYLVGDLTVPDFPRKLVDATLATHGSLDIIVNNAGYTWDSVIQKTTDEQFQAMLDINITAPFRILRAASGWIRETAKAENAKGVRVTRKVVNITSISGTDGNAGQVAYSSGKSGVLGLTKSMAKEWGRYSVTVNAVGFGLIETRLIQPWTDASASIEIKGRAIPVGLQTKALEAAKASIPLGRLGTPEEAANAVLFFCSPLSDYVTGEILICGGGLHF
jgi:3-oxoacyl-[acyl-carrier protein] reductase